jgi:uncharacterized membrane protein required for colicin V production
VDVLLVGFIGGFIYGGWRSGFIRRVIGIGFLAISFVAAGYLRYPVGAIAKTFFPNIPPDYADLVGYTIAFPAILAGLHIASAFLLRHVAVKGVSREVDAAAGAVLGGVEAVLILSAAVVIVDTYFGTSSSLGKTFPPGYLKELAQAMNGSTTVHLLRDSTVPLVLGILGPLLPKDVHTIFPGGLPTRLPFPGVPGR